LASRLDLADLDEVSAPVHAETLGSLRLKELSVCWCAEGAVKDVGGLEGGIRVQLRDRQRPRPSSGA
jgi:hypothetical protein